MSGSSAETTGDSATLRHIRKYLRKLRQGDMFVHGFGKDDFDKLLDSDGNLPPITEKKHVFNKFLTAVARDLANGSKSERRAILDRLHSSRNHWVEEIKHYRDNEVESDMDIEEEGATPNTTASEELETKTGEKIRAKSSAAGAEDPPEEQDKSLSLGTQGNVNEKGGSKPKKAGKKGKSASAPKKGKGRKKRKQAEPVRVRKSQALLQQRDAMKREFEEKKERILSEIPDDVRTEFGQIGFAKWGKSVLPVMFLSPYHVPPGAVREKWMASYEKTKGHQDRMERLVYWYGEQNMNKAFSLVPKKSCMTYEEGVMKGNHKLKASVQKKLDQGKKMSKAEQDLVRGLEEINAHAPKDPTDRKLPFANFVEEYEIFEFEGDEEVDEELISSDEEPPPPKKATGKGSKKAQKKQKQEESVAEAVEEDFAENEVSSGEEYEEDVVTSEDDDADLNYEPDTSVKSKKRKRGDSPAKSPKKKKPKKAKIERKRSKGATKALKEEQRRFEQCEKKFLPLEERWKSSLKTGDGKDLAVVITDLSQFVDSLSASFIETYQLPQLMKESKPILKKMEREYGVYKTVWNSMKELYQAGKGKIPEGFVPTKKKRSSASKAVDSKQASASNKGETKVRRPGSEDKPEKLGGEKNENNDSELRGHNAVDLASTRVPEAAGPASPALSRATSQIGLDSPYKSSTQQAKSERKTFSLSHLMRGKDSELDDDVSHGAASAPFSDRTSTSDRHSSASQGPPNWVRTAPATCPASLDGDRAFALEFLQTAACMFPEGTVDVDSAAKSLEDAVFKWSQARGGADWVEPYWEKVHSLVAAICGKRETGLLVNHILSGRYQAASDVVSASDEVLKRSFGE